MPSAIHLIGDPAMNEKEKRTIDVLCQSCNLQVAATEVANHVKSNRRHWNPDPVDDFYDVIEHVLVECGRCESVSLVQLTVCRG